MNDDEFDTKKKPLCKEKHKSRRWSNCFGLSKKFKRLKNRLSTIQANDPVHQKLSIQRNSNITLNHEYPHHQQYSTSTIHQQEPATESNEHGNIPPTATYDLSPENTPNQSLSPPPRHGQTGRGRAFSDMSGYCYNDWRQFTDSYKKMNLRLSLDTESIHQQHQQQRQDDTNTNTSNSITSGSSVAIASVRDSMIIYQEDDASTLRAHSNSSTISNSSSLTPQAPPTLAPHRSGTLGYPRSGIKTDIVPPLPPLLNIQRQQQPPTSSDLSLSTASSGRLSVDSISRLSTISSIDIPLKERRRRRSPLMFSDNDKLTLPIPRHDVISIQHNIHSNDNNKRTVDSTMHHDRGTTKWKSREKAMQQLEGGAPSDRKVISMTRIASPKFLDEQLVAAAEAAAVAAAEDPTLLMNKAQYDAVVSRTTQRRPSSSIVLTPKVSGSPHSNGKYSTTSPFLPTPSSSSSHHYPPPPLPPPPSSSVYFPSTPNSLDSYL